MTWKEAIIKALLQSRSPLSPLEIAEIVERKGYYDTSNASTPANTISAAINRSLNEEGSESPFVGMGRGLFSLRSYITPPTHTRDGGSLYERIGRVVQASSSLPASSSSLPPQPSALPPTLRTVNPSATETAKNDSNNQRQNVDELGQPTVSPTDEKNSLIKSFGMYWDRTAFERGGYKVCGRQIPNSKPIDFSTQTGVYILYDNHHVVYAGQANARMGERLKEHTKDRLAGRWNRFSWFGFLDVKEDGTLEKFRSFAVGETGLLNDLEAFLIEALEPPQNRKRGDNFGSIEYLQA